MIVPSIIIPIFFSILFFFNFITLAQDSIGKECFTEKTDLNTQTISRTDSSNVWKWEIFPIINYDTDVGFGYGAKAFLYNFLSNYESIDITIYNSTKGERWYQLIYSFPDKQKRHRTKYSFGFDIIIDYDKLKNATYYSDSQGDYSNSIAAEETYTKEPISITALFSKAVTNEFILESGIKHQSISCYNFNEVGNLKDIAISNSQHISFILNFIYDARDNIINTNEGILLRLNSEIAYDLLGGEHNYLRGEISLQNYSKLFKSEIIFASRLRIASISNVGFPNKLIMGGQHTIRGLPQDRYFAQSLVLFNQEIRFPIYWRFGSVLGVDIGKANTTANWIANGVLGIRFYMDNFIVRADFGVGSSTTGFYFNFGHLF